MLNKKKFEECEGADFSLTKALAGLIIILVGFAFLFKNLDLIDFDFNLFSLWPLLVVLLGLMLLSKKNLVSDMVGVITIILVLVALFFVIFPHRNSTQEQPEINKTPVLLFYYKQSEDEGLACGPDAVLPVGRKIETTLTPIKDTINLLIKGELTEEEKIQGFTTEFPNPDFKLLDVNLKDGVLYLEFTEVPGFTTGGSCRISLLTNQIIKTAKQFPGVNEVILLPESIFQP
ncbi:MAG: GerMN domain-containing protein [Candidatus Pacebacteria bacterium]|nr:GerMN domain-containing protein [Candidatus Paceibacterota bacterium]MDD5555098.1 GerMN domain-containing protein [Candidatus Paceibacterota bacterium]